MKQEGVNSEELIKTLMANNTAFEKKTGYSQEKWVQRASKR